MRSLVSIRIIRIDTRLIAYDYNNNNRMVIKVLKQKLTNKMMIQRLKNTKQNSSKMIKFHCTVC